MPGIRFEDLARRFISALEMAGATVLVASPADARPLDLSVVMEDKTYRLEVYLWAITPGGAGRGRPRERRIQMTGVSRFTLKSGVRTILGGWSEEAGVFAFWDVRRHLNFTAGSSSLQISLDTLENAGATGMATEVRNVREGEEIAIGVHPDYLMWYVTEYTDLYDGGPEVSEAARLVEAQPEVERGFIDSGDTPESQARRHKVVEVVKTFREARFRPLVLRAYSYRCCLTGMALRLIDAAHVVPVSDPTSTDEVKNGVALMPLMHRAYDRGLLGLLPTGKAAVNERKLAQLRDARLDAGYDILRNLVPSTMRFPGSPDLRPPPDYLIRGLKCRGWTDEEIRLAS